MGRDQADLAGLPNVNAVWAHLLVEELCRQGVEHFAIAPGSRSTPLVVAAVRNARATTHLVHDERGAAFFALGIGRATGRPAAVITTSGTAVANLLPAVVEASNDCVPLVVLSADRPPELRDCGANQAIEQGTIFAPFVRFRHDLGCPTDQVAARYVVALAGQAAQRATGDFAGPVHLNCPFREPLAPTDQAFDRSGLAELEAWWSGDAPWVARHVAGSLDPDQVSAVAERLGTASSGVVIAGSCPVAERSDAIAALAQRLGWPLVPDVRSGLRLGCATARPDWLPTETDPDPTVVLQFGGRLVDARLQAWLDRRTGERIVITPDPRRTDPGHRGQTILSGVPARIARALLTALESGSTTPGRESSRTERTISPDAPHGDPSEPAGGEAGANAGAQASADAHASRGAGADANAGGGTNSGARPDATERTNAGAGPDDSTDSGEALTEPFVARFLSRQLRDGDGWFVSSSMPIRDVQRWAACDGAAPIVDANRGASGIDGVVATAAGFCLGLGRPTTLLIGDLALLHDLNSLAIPGRQALPLGIVVWNNGGGSIFRNLPIAAHDDVFTPWFDGAHELQFDGAAKMFGLAHRRVTTREEFAAAWHELEAPYVLEVTSSQSADQIARDELRNRREP